jgi:Type II secretion system (T2SS), protein E, N-terminal domain
MGRLIHDAGMNPRLLAEAFAEAERRRCSFLEMLILRDIELAEVIAECFGSDGAAADPSWRLDSALMRELPPTMPERLLAFPFRERAGSIEVVTVTPLDPGLRVELETHLRSPLRLYRGSLQALLAAGGARVDWNAISLRSRPPPMGGQAPLPLVRRGRQRERERVRTSPGLGGGKSSQSSPGPSDAPVPQGIEVGPNTSRADLILSASRPIELAQALGPGLPAPAHIGALSHSGVRWFWGGEGLGPIEVDAGGWSELEATVQAASFRGSCPPNELPLALRPLYAEETLVRVEILGDGSSGLLVVFPETDSSIPLRLVALARARWAEI